MQRGTLKSMRALRTTLRYLLLLSLVCAPLWSQTVLKALSSAAHAAAPVAPGTDPLGRTSPRGTLTGFMEAAQRGDNDRAAQYLQLPRQENAVDAARIITDLKTLLDHAYIGRLASVTDSPEPPYDPQLEPNYARGGEF